MWGRSRAARGSVTLEAALLYPLVLSVCLMVLLMLVQLYGFAQGTDRMLGALRQESLDWVRDGDGLYWDARDFLGQEGTEAAVRRLEERMTPLQEPYGLMSRAGSEQPLLSEPRLWGEVERTFFRVGPTEAGLRIRILSARFLPAMILRQITFLENDLLPALAGLTGDAEEASGPESPSAVYIVDDSAKAHDYLKVYHLHSECQYVRNKQPQVLSRQEAVSGGFRACLVCLKKDLSRP